MRDVLEDLYLFPPENDLAVQAQGAELIGQLNLTIKKLEDPSNFNPLFLGMVRRDIIALKENIEDCATRLYELSGSREDLLHGMMKCLRSLGVGDMYAAMTLPSLWSAMGLGLKGRFFTMNLLAAKRGVTIKRVFVVTSRELNNARVREVLEAQQQAFNRLKRTGLSTETNKRLDTPGCYIGYQVVSDEAKNHIVTHGRNFGLVRAAGTYTRVALDYQIEDSAQKVLRLTNVRLWRIESQKRLEDHIKELNQYLENSEPISNWKAIN